MFLLLGSLVISILLSATFLCICCCLKNHHFLSFCDLPFITIDGWSISLKPTLINSRQVAYEKKYLLTWQLVILNPCCVCWWNYRDAVGIFISLLLSSGIICMIRKKTMEWVRKSENSSLLFFFFFWRDKQDWNFLNLCNITKRMKEWKWQKL